MPEQTTDLHARIFGLIEQGEFSQVEDAWFEVIEGPPADPAFYVRFAKAMRKAKALDGAHALLVLLLEELQKRSEWALSYEIVERLADFWGSSPELRRIAGRALRQLHAGDKNLDAMLAASKGLPLPDALARFREQQRFQPGNVFTHAYWGEGIVRDLDFGGGTVTLDFPNESGKKIALDFARKHLTHLPADSFRARRASDLESVRSQAAGDPAGVVKSVLRDFGGRVKQTDLKALLAGSVVDDAQWTFWWSRTRDALRQDPFVELPAKPGPKSEIVLRETPKSFEEEIGDVLADESSSLRAQGDALRKLAAHGSNGDVTGSVVQRAFARLEHAYRDENATVVRRAEIALLADELQRSFAGMVPAASGIARPEEAVAHLQAADLNAFEDSKHVEIALDLMTRTPGTISNDALWSLLPDATPDLAQAIWSSADLQGGRDAAMASFHAILERPLHNPETYLWAAKLVLESQSEQIAEVFPYSTTVPDMIDKMDEWERLIGSPSASKEAQSQAKALISRVRTLLQARQFEPVREALEHMTVDQARRLLRTIQASEALTDSFRVTSEKRILAAFPELDAEHAAAARAAEAPPEFHYCTARARQRALKELRELQEITIPANAREIENARQEGDLKENAGYIFAKEKQKLLMQKLMRLQDDVRTARTISADSIKDATIGFGVSFEAENLSSGAHEKYTVLGRLETDPDNHIVSYQSPFIEPFIGKRANEEVTVKPPDGPETGYRVISIAKALGSGEWDAEAEE